jgi:hypothetical protein
MHLYLREKTKKISNLCKKKNLELLIYMKERKRKKKNGLLIIVEPIHIYLTLPIYSLVLNINKNNFSDSLNN